MNCKSFAIAAAASVAMIASAQARDEIQIKGSSTVLPYAQIVAENFQKEFPNFKASVAGGGSSGGLKEFCGGIGPSTIDIANASRKIKDSEIAACADAGVTEIVEVQFGYDGIVFASDVNGPAFALEPKDVFLALGESVNVSGKLVPNPNETLDQVNGSFPKWDVKMWIPGEKHGTREVFEKKVLLAGCKETGAFDLYKESGLDKKGASKACYRVRKDGASVDIDGDYTETLQRLEQNKESIGVFGLAFYENNTDKLRVATMSGVSPSVDTVATGEYPVSRPLFFYVKKQHLGVIPGLQEYVDFFVSDDMVGPGGPLAEYGLVPAPDGEREELRANVGSAKTL